jgi:hypothetical protein
MFDMKLAKPFGLQLAIAVSSAPHGDEVFTFVDRYSSAPPSPTAIGDGKVTTLFANFTMPQSISTT